MTFGLFGKIIAMAHQTFGIPGIAKARMADVLGVPQFDYRINLPALRTKTLVDISSLMEIIWDSP
jgi:hypothetical protein